MREKNLHPSWGRLVYSLSNKDCKLFGIFSFPLHEAVYKNDISRVSALLRDARRKSSNPKVSNPIQNSYFAKK